MKLSRLLCVLLALAFLLTCFPASLAKETNLTYFSFKDMKDPETGVTFYDLMQGKDSGYDGSMNVFYRRRLPPSSSR